MSIESYPSPNGVLTSLIWRKTMSGAETSLSGYDNASQALSYTPGQEQVYLNGILLVRGDDYTATNGTSITGLSALAASDYVQVNCYNNFSVASVPAQNITGTVTNAQLANSAITINGSAISLGGTVTLAGDIESVTATSPLTGGGSTGALTVGIQEASTSQRGSVQLSDSTSTTSSVLAATPTAVKSAYDLANGAIPKTLTTTTGDIIYASSANTPDRRAIGTAGQVLTVNSGATAPEWATPSSGSMTQIVAPTSLGTGTSVTISSIPQTYKDLRIIIRDWSSAASAPGIRISFVDGGQYYAGWFIDYVGAITNSRSNSGRTYFEMGGAVYFSATSNYLINLYDYTNTSWKFGDFFLGGGDGGSGADGCHFGAFRRSTSTGISTITLAISASTFDAGTYEVWGIK